MGLSGGVALGRDVGLLLLLLSRVRLRMEVEESGVFVGGVIFVWDGRFVEYCLCLTWVVFWRKLFCRFF